MTNLPPEPPPPSPIDAYLELIKRVRDSGRSQTGTRQPPAPLPNRPATPAPTRPTAPLPTVGAIRQPGDPDPNYATKTSPVEGFLNAIFSGAAGGANVLNKVINEGAPTSIDNAFGPGRKEIMKGGLEQYKQQGMAAIPQPGFSPEQEYWIAGQQAAWNSDYGNPNLVWGSDVINNYVTSRGGQALNREDAPWYERTNLFLGGLALDIALDPITYTPPGIFAAPIRGIVKGAQAAKGLQKVPAGLKGAYAGSADLAYKAGKFTGRPKPVGLRQWAELRQYDSVINVARRSNIPIDDLFRVTSGQLAPEALAKAVNQATAGTSKATSYTAADITNIVDNLRRGGGLDAAERMHYGVLHSPTGQRYFANPLRTSGKAATAGERLYDKQPATQQNYNPWYAMDDGVSAPPPNVHNTFAKTNTQILDIPPTATYEEATEALTRILRNPESTQDAKDAAFRAYEELIETLPSGRNIVSEIEQIIAGINNPAVAAKIAEKTAGMPAETPSQQISQLKQIIDDLAEADANVGSNQLYKMDDADEFGTRARIFEQVADSVDTGSNYRAMEQARYRMLLDPAENAPEIWFGTNKAWSGIREAYTDRIGGITEVGSDSVYNAIRALAELPIDVPGYSDKARAFVARVEASDATERYTIINELNRKYEDSLIRIGALDDTGRPVNVSDTAWERIAEGRTLYANQLPITEAPGTATELGKFVNIFGDIVDDPMLDITKAIQGATSKAVKDLDAGVTPGAAARELRKAVDEMTKPISTANIDGLKGADSIPGRTLASRAGTAGKKLSEEQLAAPNVPRALDDIYDHVVGFARVPLGFDEWIDALKRVAATNAAVAPSVIKLIKRLGLNNQPVNVAKVREAYAKYTRVFDALPEKILPAELGGKIVEGRVFGLDETVGIDLLGRVFRNDYAIEGEVLKQTILYKSGKPFRAEGVSGAAPVAKFIQAIEKRRAERITKAAETVEGMRELSVAERARLADQVDVLKTDAIRARGTDGAWITNPRALVKGVTEGDVAANAANLVEELKLYGGLEEGLSQVLPTLKYRKSVDTNDIVYEESSVRKLVEGSGRNFDQTVEATKSALRTQDEIIFNVIELAAQRFKQKTQVKTVPFKEFIRTMRGTRGPQVFKYDEGKYTPDRVIQGRIAEGSKTRFTREFTDMDISPQTEKLPWVNMEPIRGALDEVLDAAGVPVDLWAQLRPQLWDAMLKNMGRSESGLNLNYDKVIDDFVDAPFRTGNVEPGVVIEAGPGLVENALMSIKGSNTSLSLVAKNTTYNSALRINPANTVEDYIDQVEKIFAELTYTHKNIDPQWLRKTAEVIARTTGDTSIDAQNASGEVLFNYIKSKTPQLKGLLTESKAQEIARAEAINNYTLFNGDFINQMAKKITPSRILLETRKVANDNLAKIINKTERETVREASVAGYTASIRRLSSQGATKRVPGTKWRTYQQNAVYTAYKAAKSVIDQKFAKGSIENWNATVFASRDMRALLRESGIVETTVLKPFGGKIVPKETMDADFAYINWLDVMDASLRAVKGGLPEDVFRVALDVHTVNGLTFPQTVLAEAGAMAMKMANSGMDETTRIPWLYDYIRHQIKNIKGYDEYAKEINEEITTPTAKIVAMLARSLGSDNTIANLTQRHNTSGALAVAVAEKNSAEIVEPILNAVRNVADNAYATPGDINSALTKSVEALRQELLKRGYVKGSLESIISLKSLERTIVDSVSANTLNGARVQERMARAAENPATFRQTANVERKNIATNVNEMADEVAVQDLIGKFQLAITPDAAPEALEVVVEQIVNLSRHTIKTAQDLMDYVAQQPNTLRKPLKDTTPTQPTGVRELGVRADGLGEESNALFRKYLDLEESGVTGKALEDADLAYRAKEAEYQQSVLAYEKAVADGSKRPGTPVEDDIMNPPGVADEATDMPRTLTSFQDEKWGAQARQSMSIRAGKADLAYSYVGAKGLTDSVINATENRLEAVARKHRKLPQEQINGMLVKLAKTTLEGGAEARKAFIQNLKPEWQDFAKSFFWALGHLFDPKTISRTGLDSKWIDKHLLQSSIAGVPKARLTPRDRNVFGWEIEQAYNKMIIDVLEAGPDGGGTDWLDLFKGLNQAIYDSTLIPNMGADFSARFGHEAAGMTAEQAQKMVPPWVRIRTGEGAGDLARFLDETQYFPQDIARQLANMERMLGAKTQPDSLVARKFWRWFDRVQGTIKAHMTLWAPSHHAVSSVGEAGSNLIAGEASPRNMFYALKVMAAGSDITLNPTSAFRHNKTREMDLFKELNFTPSPEDAKGLIKTNILGEDGKRMSFTTEQMHDLLENTGIKITNNTVEDYTYRNSQLVRDGNLLRKMATPFIATTRALGEFASRRDNLFRFQHAIGLLRGTNKRAPKVFRNIDEAKDYIQREIFEWHPTAQSLAPLERNLMRRMFLFYTWQRLALNRILESVIDDPFRLGVMPKAVQNISAAMGGDPQGPGHPMPNDVRLPTFAREHILGPAWYDENGEVNSIAVSSPQLDLFQTFFGGFGYDDSMSAMENIGFNLGEVGKLAFPQLSPALKLIPESMSGTAISPSDGGPEITDWGQHISDQLGFGRQSIITGITPLSSEAPYLFNLRDYDANRFSSMTPAEIDWLRRRTALNLMTGLKWDIKSRFFKSAQAEQQEYMRRRNRKETEEILRNINQ